MRDSIRTEVLWSYAYALGDRICCIIEKTVAFFCMSNVVYVQLATIFIGIPSHAFGYVFAQNFLSICFLMFLSWLYKNILNASKG